MSEAIFRGYHFLPTEEELIHILMDFLECKSQGKQFPPNPVAEKVLYGENATPWEIFGDDDAWESAGECDGGKKGVKEVIYVFTQLSSRSAKKKARTAGCGTWEGQTGIKELENGNGEIIGFRKMLSFRVKETSESQQEKGQWRMHEYSLSGVSLQKMALKKIDLDNYVVCKITRDYSRCENPTKDQILGKRKFEEDGTESSYYHSNKHRRTLMELVQHYEAFPGEAHQSEDHRVVVWDSGTCYATEIASSQEGGEIVISNSMTNLIAWPNCEGLDPCATLLLEEEGKGQAQTVFSNSGADSDTAAVTVFEETRKNVVSNSRAYTTEIASQECGEIMNSDYGAAERLMDLANCEAFENSSWFDTCPMVSLQQEEEGPIVNVVSNSDTTAAIAFEDTHQNAEAAAETIGDLLQDEDEIQKSWEWFDSIGDPNLVDIELVSELFPKEPLPPSPSPISVTDFEYF